MSKWQICPHCEGESKTSAYLGVVDPNDFEPEDFDLYLEGAYDRPCEECHGTGKVQRSDIEAFNTRRSDLYQQWLEDGRPEGSFSAWSGL